MCVWTARVSYSVLTECKRHMVAIASNLDKDRTILAELASDRSFESAIIFGLGQTGIASAQWKSKSVGQCDVYLATKTQALGG